MNTTAHKHDTVRSRNEAFVDKTSTKIWCEQACEDNPYLAQSALCHGYDLIELMQKRSFVDVLYLLFRGELPCAAQTQLLETLMIGLINPGPRHPATRAAMNTGIGKTDPVHILPIASAILGGTHLGGGEVEPAMRFLRQHQKKDPATTAKQLLAEVDNIDDGNCRVAPGFGRRYGGIDILANRIAQQLYQTALAHTHLDTPVLAWTIQFTSAINTEGLGCLNTGIAAAVFADLGFQPRLGGSLFQLLGAPGLIAHGVELANKPITAMPFVKDENYVIEK